MIIYTSHRDLQEAIDKTIAHYLNVREDRMRELHLKHLTKLFEAQFELFKISIVPSGELEKKYP